MVLRVAVYKWRKFKGRGVARAPLHAVLARVAVVNSSGGAIMPIWQARRGVT